MSERLTKIQEQKRALQEKISQMEVPIASPDEAAYQSLLQRKNVLEAQKRRQDEYAAMQNELEKRKEQANQEKELKRVANEKRIAELEVAMKRAIFEGVKEKVKGVNSDQLHLRSMNRQFEGTELSQPNKIGNPDISFLTSHFAEAVASKQTKPKYGLHELNEKRMEIYEKKEETMMRQVLLKRATESDQLHEVDIISLTRPQLQREMQRLHLNLDDYMHPTVKEQVLSEVDNLQKAAENRIAQSKHDRQIESRIAQIQDREIESLKISLKKHDQANLQMVRRLLVDLFDEIVSKYELLHQDKGYQYFAQRTAALKAEYEGLLEVNMMDSIGEDICDEMIEKVGRASMVQAIQQVFALNEFAHQLTGKCFSSLMNGKLISQRVLNAKRYDFTLNFMDQNRIPKRKQRRTDSNETNNLVLEAQLQTLSLVGSLLLMSEEERYFSKVSIAMRNQQEIRGSDPVFHFDKKLYYITVNNIREQESNRVIHPIKRTEKLLQVQKIHNNWLLVASNQLSFVSEWCVENISSKIGGRIASNPGDISTACFYPIFTLAGHVCSVLVGFKKGEILKYNFNMNRLTSHQSGVTIYRPIIEGLKFLEEPAFVMENAKLIKFDDEPKAGQDLHRFREFFDFHTEEIIFVGFYSHDSFVSVDRKLQCALWQYSNSREISSYEPLERILIKVTYQTYEQSEKPRFQNVFPSESSQETPAAMYKKYMLSEKLLKTQLYNNPKKQIAYFRAPEWQAGNAEQSIWTINYNEKNKQINKIISSHYVVQKGAAQAKMAQIWRGDLYILVEKSHVLSRDLKTLKLYRLNILERSLGKLAIELNMFKEQEVSSFALMDSLLTLSIDLVALACSGRILLFSLSTGQLLKNVNTDAQKYSSYQFHSLLKAGENRFFYGITDGKIIQIHLEDPHSNEEKMKLVTTLMKNKSYLK